MYQVFNCGHRMELYVPHEIAENLVAISKSFGVDAQIVGRVEASNKKELLVTTRSGEINF